MRKKKGELFNFIASNADLIDELKAQKKNDNEIAKALGMTVAAWKSAKKKNKEVRALCFERGWIIPFFKHPDETKICLQCGTEFPARHYAKESINRFCSKRCSSLFYGEIRKEEARLKEAQARQAKQIEQESERTKYQAKKLAGMYKRIQPCKVCGRILYGRTMCKPCARSADNARRDRRIYRNGKPDLSISLERLYERDMGICKLCKNVLIFGNDTNADSYPSIDHIRPLSKGGLHTWDNVQLLCRKCNTIKSDREDVKG